MLKINSQTSRTLILRMSITKIAESRQNHGQLNKLVNNNLSCNFSPFGLKLVCRKILQEP